MRKLRPREGQRLAQGHTAKTDWMPGSLVPTLFKNFVQDELSQLPNSSVLKTIFFRLPQTPIVFLRVLPHHLLQSEPLSWLSSAPDFLPASLLYIEQYRALGHVEDTGEGFLNPAAE